MNNLSEKDYKLFKKIVSLSQKELKAGLEQIVKNVYKEKTIITNDYIVGIGDIPIALVAHMDTVFNVPVKDLYYDRQQNVLWSPQGLGADDRAGVFAILKILQSNLRPSVIFTVDEEKGGLGANELAQKKCPIEGLKYLIELDRRGKDDCVFYDCDNAEFFQYVANFGFSLRWGTFSDISFLMGDWSVCGVNLSIGYENEHSYTETLNITHMNNTIEKVKKMLSEKDIPTFEYIEYVYPTAQNAISKSYDLEEKSTKYKCGGCKNKFDEFDLYPVKCKNNKTKSYCVDCLCKKVEWCLNCDEAYERVSGSKNNLCPDCEELLNV